MKKIFGIFNDKRGATAIEYGLIAALIAIAAITAMTALGGEVNEAFTNTEVAMGNANSGTRPAAD